MLFSIAVTTQTHTRRSSDCVQGLFQEVATNKNGFIFRALKIGVLLDRVPHKL